MDSSKTRIPDLLKQPVKRALWAYRRATAASRRLPDLIVIGAQKAGTTSLHAWLTQHPQILPPFEKEVHYFDGGLDPYTDNFVKGTDWYRAHFPTGAAAAGKIAFETTPLYLFHPLAASRIKEQVPNAKLIAVLRNPVERAVSHYFHTRRNGGETLSMADAFAAEEQRLARAGEDYSSPNYIRHSYKARGRYAEQLDRYMQLFEKDQLLVIDSEGLFERPAEYMQRVYAFAGVDARTTTGELRARNVAPKKDGVDPQLRDELNNYFRPHNQALYEMLGEEFTW